MNANALAHVPCNLCGTDQPQVLCVENGFRICRCSACSLVYVTPRPVFTLGEDVEYYPDAAQTAERVRLLTRSIFAAGLTQLNQYYPQKGRILDVGCGFGFFLAQAQLAGWQPVGVDVSTVAVKYAKEKLGLAQVRRADLLGVSYPAKSFDVATLWNLLEHVTDPLAILHEVQRILVEDGLVVVRVPNMVFHEALRPFWRILSLTRVRKPGYLGGVSPPHHLYGFTPRTLCLMLDRAGFDVLTIEPALLRNNRKSIGLVAARTVASVVAKVVYHGSFGRFILSPTMIAFAERKGCRGKDEAESYSCH